MRTRSKARTPRTPQTFGRMRRRVRRRTARRGAGGRALRQAAGLPPPPPTRACRHAFLISVARGFAPLMTMPAAFAAPPPPGPRCRPLRLYLRAATIKKTRPGRSPAWIFGGWAQPPPGFRIRRGVQCQMDRTRVYPGTNPATAFIHVPRPTTARVAGTGPIQPPADAALTMMHRAPSPPAAGAADFRRHPLNRAPPFSLRRAVDKGRVLPEPPAGDARHLVRRGHHGLPCRHPAAQVLTAPCNVRVDAGCVRRSHPARHPPGEGAPRLGYAAAPFDLGGDPLRRTCPRHGAANKSRAVADPASMPRRARARRRGAQPAAPPAPCTRASRAGRARGAGAPIEVGPRPAASMRERP